ncbi:MAG: hypothetical protein EXR50_01290 [Dehalococcoidia bacterium]|nr:hypothetical protein [Dehalococcoidia bacterium]
MLLTVTPSRPNSPDNRSTALRWSHGWLGPIAIAGTLAGYYFSSNLALSAVFALAFLIGAFKWLDWALVSVLFTSPLYRFPKTIDLNVLGLDLLGRRTVPLEFSVGEFALLACAAAWAGRRLLNRRYIGDAGIFDKRLLPFIAPAVALLFVAALSVPFSEFQKVSLRELRTVILEPVIFYFALLDTLRGREYVSRMLKLYVLLGAGISVAALYHYFFIGVTEATGGVSRILAIYHSPNALALFLGRIIPVAFALALAKGLGRASWRGTLPFLAALLPMAVVLYLTYSRGAWLAVALNIILMLFVVGKSKLAGGALLVAIAASILLLVLFQDRVLSSAPVLQRVYVWEAAINLIKDHPLMGVGLDNFLYHYPGYMLPEAWAEPNVSHPHNIFLDFWLRLGILGIIVLACLQAVFWSKANKLYRRSDGSKRWMILATMGSMASFLIHGLFDNSFFLIDLAYQVWFIMAMMAILDADSSPIGATD